jgi:hypothetical protein
VFFPGCAAAPLSTPDIKHSEIEVDTPAKCLMKCLSKGMSDRMGADGKTETFDVATENRSNALCRNNSFSARYLGEDQLGGVIFGYMPLFLFNSSDRKMDGIFENTCAG